MFTRLSNALRALPMPWTSQVFLNACYLFTVGFNLASLGADVASRQWHLANVPLRRTKGETWKVKLQKATAERDLAQLAYERFRDATQFDIGIPISNDTPKPPRSRH